MKLSPFIVALLLAAAGCVPPPMSSKPGGSVVTVTSEVAKPDRNAADKDDWAEPAKGRWLRIGAVQMTIDEVTVGKAQSDNPIGGSSKEDLLLVSIRLRNTDPKKKVDYQPWVGTLIGSHKLLRDDLKNEYKAVSFLGGVKGQIAGPTAIHAEDGPVSDVLTFERPIAAASYLLLELDAEAVGQKGAYRWKIPKSAWSK
jgi:hypothetical protein